MSKVALAGVELMTEIECGVEVETELLKVKTRAVESEPRGRGEVADAEADAEDRVKLSRVRAETAEAAATEANNKIKAVLMLGRRVTSQGWWTKYSPQLSRRATRSESRQTTTYQGTSHHTQGAFHQEVKACFQQSLHPGPSSRSQSLLPTKVCTGMYHRSQLSTFP
jgi:hypothetical protein